MTVRRWIAIVLATAVLGAFAAFAYYYIALTCCAPPPAPVVPPAPAN